VFPPRKTVFPPRKTVFPPRKTVFPPLKTVFPPRNPELPPREILPPPKDPPPRETLPPLLRIPPPERAQPPPPRDPPPRWPKASTGTTEIRIAIRRSFVILSLPLYSLPRSVTCGGGHCPLIGRWPIERRNRHAVQPEIHRQLRPVMDHMVHNHRPVHRDPGHGEHRIAGETE